MGLMEKNLLRDRLLKRLRFELAGPGSSDTEQLEETLSESPTQRYLVGILWPGGSHAEAEDDESFESQNSSEESGAVEPPVPYQKAMKPSSIGMSFLLNPDKTHLSATVSWGSYVPVSPAANQAVEATDPSEAPQQKEEDNHEEQLPENKQPSSKANKNSPTHWKRKHHAATISLNFAADLGSKKHLPLADGITLEWLARPIEGLIAASVFLVNRQPRPESGPSDLVCLFQPEIRLTDITPEATGAFRARDQLYAQFDYDPEIEQDRLLYRDNLSFAVGHGTATSWTISDTDAETAREVRTVLLPDWEIPRIIPPQWSGAGSLDMQTLAAAKTPEDMIDMLQPLPDAYRDWMDLQFEKIQSLPEALKKQAEEHLENCEKACVRIQKGIDLIVGRPDVFEALRFANHVMAEQRIHALSAVDCRRKSDWSNFPDRSIRTQWRPFQMAFILMALAGIVEPTHDDRDVCDLLWFPTGGGKTEAYLGLTAFTLALRRLGASPSTALRSDAGVGVLMRYTLRLLTVQQFQRAAALICACEIERKRPESNGKWGARPFRVGLWIGSTPKTFDAAKSALQSTASAQQSSGEKESPVQIVSCPWCGHEILPKNYISNQPARRIFAGCPRRGCSFNVLSNSEGIPAIVTDEEVYRLLPDLVIGTVDKFARLPWVGESSSLFGMVSSESPRWGFLAPGASSDTRNSAVSLEGTTSFLATRSLQPPDLIIQDELHLISGPLGSLAGLYETAVDRLASRMVDGKLRGPKVIASTATIRRAIDQVNLLFARNLSIFPPPAIDAGDSFFAKEQLLTTTPGRLFAGIYAPGKSIKTALVRTYAALLSGIESETAEIADKDPYMTLVGYFNSLRELGGAIRLIEDDIPSRISTLSKRPASDFFTWKSRYLNHGNEVPELTSRIGPREIPDILRKLEQPFSSSPSLNNPLPLDVLLASNMISVGVDVPRLGLMVVNGQPKTSSEYIQATSRIGREFPGLVITVYNWARPRDTSHYENFQSYHAALYKNVESISITPFASRARDRALAAILVAMNRFSRTDMASDANAGKFRSTLKEAEENRDFVTQRISSTDGARRLDVVKHIEHIYDRWNQCAEAGQLNYSKPKIKLLKHMGSKSKAEFSAPDSMRDVETAAKTYIKE